MSRATILIARLRDEQDFRNDRSALGRQAAELIEELEAQVNDLLTRTIPENCTAVFFHEDGAVFEHKIEEQPDQVGLLDHNKQVDRCRLFVDTPSLVAAANAALEARALEEG